MLSRRGFLMGSVSGGGLAAIYAKGAMVHGLHGVAIAGVSGDPLVGGTSFGLQNAYGNFGDVWSTYAWQGYASTTPMAVIGAQGGKGFQLGLTNPVAMNAYTGTVGAGDHWYFFRMRTPSTGSSVSGVSECVLGVTGSSPTACQFGYTALTAFQGAADTGWEVASTAGTVVARREGKGGSSWSWMPSTKINANMQFACGANYGVALGTEYVTSPSAGDTGRMVLATLGGSIPVSQSSGATYSMTQRPAAPLFSLIGAVGAPNNSTMNYGGEISDVWIVSGVPFPPDASVQALTNGAMTMLAYVTSQGGTAANMYHNPLDYSQVNTSSSPYTLPHDPNYTLSALDVTVANNGAANSVGLTTCGPHRGNNLLTLNRLYPWWVWPIAAAGTDGQVWFEGTCAFSGATIQARLAYANGTFSSWTTIASGTGPFAASIRSPWKQPFCRQVQIQGQPTSIIQEYDLHDVGAVIVLNGQSEVSHGNYTALSHSGSPVTVTNSTGAGDANSGGDGGGFAVTIPIPTTTTQPFASYLDALALQGAGQTYSRGLGWIPALTLITGGSLPGDGCTNIALAVLTHIGCSVMIVGLTHSGIPQDCWVWGNQTWTLPSTGVAGAIGVAALNAGAGVAGAGSASSPFTFTCAASCGYKASHSGPANALVRNLTGNAKIALNAGYVNQVQPGSLQITLSDGSVITDSVTSTPNAGPKCTQVGALIYQSGNAGSNPIDAASSITYVNGTGSGNKSGFISLVFADGSPPTVDALSWTNVQGLVNGSANEKTTWINNWGVWQAFNQLLSIFARFGVTAFFSNWVSNLLSEATPADANAVNDFALDILGKTSVVRSTVQAFNYGSIDVGCSNFPVVLAPKGRVNDGGSQDALGVLDLARAAQTSLWPPAQNAWPGGSNAPSAAWIKTATWVCDISLEGAPPGTATGHPGSYLPPGSGTFTQTTPGWGRVSERQGLDIVAAITGDTAWNLVPSWGTPVISENTITLPVNDLPSGASLTTDTVNGGSNSACEGFWIGTSKTLGVIVDNVSYATAAIGGPCVFITKVSGNWTGSEIVRYLVGMPNNTSTPVIYPPVGNIYAVGGTIANGTTLLYSPGLPLPPIFASSAQYP